MARSLILAVLVVAVIVVAEARPSRNCRKCKDETRDPVCGTDGHTYNHECQLERLACFTGRDVQVESVGKCQKSEIGGGGNNPAEEEGSDSEEEEGDDSEEEEEEEPAPSSAAPPSAPMATSKPPAPTNLPTLPPQPSSPQMGNPTPITTNKMPSVSEQFPTVFVTEDFLTDVSGTQPPAGMETRSSYTTMAQATPCATSCPLIDNMPVCGTDGITYTSRCVLEAEACMIRDDTLQVAYEGPCLVTLGLIQPSKTPAVMP